MTNQENKFFVYEGAILRATQPKFTTAMTYFKKSKGREIFRITPLGHKTDLTKIANKLIFSECK